MQLHTSHYQFLVGLSGFIATISYSLIAKFINKRTVYMISIAGTAIANLWLGTVNFITHTTGDCILVYFLHLLYLYLFRNPWPVLFASEFEVFWACQWSLCRRKCKLYSANFGDRLANAGYCIMSNTDHVLKWIVSDEVALYCRWHCTSYNVHDVVCCYENILQFGVLVGYAVVVLHLWRNFHHRVRWPPFICHFVSTPAKIVIRFILQAICFI